MGRNADPSTPLSDRFDLEGVIRGLATDLEALRAGRITVADAATRADLAKQIMNGVRLVVSAQRYLEQRAKQIEPPSP
jgi:hypothetical protein